MSGWCIFHEVKPDAGKLFVGEMTKGECYVALEALDKDVVATLHDEETLRWWTEVLGEHTNLIALMLHGDFRSKGDGYDDPSVTFIGASTVLSISGLLASEAGNIVHRLSQKLEGHGNLLWLYRPLKEFFDQATARANAVILLSDRGDRLVGP